MVGVVIYTRPFCIWCFKAKWLLSRRGIAFEERNARSDEARAELLARTGRKTVPQVFVNDSCVGGYEDLQRFLQKAAQLS